MTPLNRIILGTVQFGLDYGINNNAGKPSEESVFRIFDKAREIGISRLDTADAYGNALNLIGKYHTSHGEFSILNKFSSSADLIKNFEASLKRLDVSSLEAYSYHSFRDFINNPHSWPIMKSLKKQLLIKKIGVSVYTNEEISGAIDSEIIDVIQIPFNILDNHNRKGHLLAAAKSMGKEIHVRSVFLQGLIFMDEMSLPVKLRPLLPYLNRIRDLSLQQNLSLEEIALTYVMNHPQIDGVLMGVDNIQQLLKNIGSIRQSKAGIVHEFIDSIDVSETELLNPSNWK